MVPSSDSHSATQAVITTAATMEEVHQHIDHCLKEASSMLAAFDIDMTLTAPQHPACHYPNMQQHKSALRGYMLLQRVFGCTGEVEEDKALTLGTQLPSQQLIEEITPALIASLQKRGIKTIALTASLSGGVPGLESLKERRFQGLQQVGIDFSKTFSHEELLFSEFPPHNNCYPIYHQGILYANGGKRASNKGAVLVALLKKVGWAPRQVVMVDDLVGNLTAVEQALTSFDPTIQFIGIEYRGAQTHAPEGITKKEMIAYWKGILKRIKANR